MANPDRVLREQLLALLEGGQAHMSFDDAVKGFPMKEINHQVPNASYTVWQALEHVRRTQRDIRFFVEDRDYISPDFPSGYWPEEDEEATPAQWRKTIEGIRSDLEAVEGWVKNRKTDFFGPIPHAPGYTVFREVLLVADHNAWHTSELVTLRRVLNLKPVKEY
jgi:hypothetical protein